MTFLWSNSLSRLTAPFVVVQVAAGILGAQGAPWVLGAAAAVAALAPDMSTWSKVRYLMSVALNLFFVLTLCLVSSVPGQVGAQQEVVGVPGGLGAMHLNIFLFFRESRFHVRSWVLFTSCPSP